MPVQPLQNIPDSPDISLNDVSFTSMTVHMETVYAADKNVTSFDVSWIPHDGAIVPGFQCLHHWIGRSYNIYFLWLGEEYRRNQRKLGGRQCNHRTEYP
jgi:hypothetical protein